MDYLKELKHLLIAYIEEDRARKEKYNKYDKLKKLFWELLEYLKCDYITLNDEKNEVAKLFREIYPNDIYLLKFYEILKTLNDDKEARLKFRQLCSDLYADYKKITEEMDILKNQIEQNKYMVASANRVKLCFEHNLQINQNKYDIPNVKDIISYYQLSGRISNKKEVLLINEIELYNRKTASLKGNVIEKNYSDKIYSEIPNILNAGFYLYCQEDDEIEIAESRKGTINTFIETLFALIKTIPNDEIIKEVQQYRDYYKIDDNEYQYIIVNLLDKLFWELRVYYDMLIDKEIYHNRNNRTEIVNGYYKLLDKYLVIFGYYEEYYKIPTMGDISLGDISHDFLGNEPKKLIYAHSNLDSSKPRILKDLKSMNEEYYERAYRLLNDYMNNTISVKEVKTLQLDKMPNFIELKDDQVRIVLRHMKNNIYAVLGLFTKKEDNDPATYHKIVKRSLPKINTEDEINMEFELASICEAELAKLVENKGRKGNR